MVSVFASNSIAVASAFNLATKTEDRMNENMDEHWQGKICAQNETKFDERTVSG